MKTLKESLLDIDSNLEKDDIKPLIEEWLKECDIKNYKINDDDYTIDVNGDVIIAYKTDMTEFPSYINFRNVYGMFNITRSALTSLRGCPVFVSKTFKCWGCDNLKSLEGAPEKVSILSISRCNGLRTLEGAPKYVDTIRINLCKNLVSLEGCPAKIDEFSCLECPKLKTLEGAPKSVSGDFNCHGCTGLISLKGAPKEVRSFDCSSCTSLTNLEGSPRSVKYYFDCSDCGKLISLKGSPRVVGEDFICKYCGALTTIEGLPTKIGGTFWYRGTPFVDLQKIESSVKISI